MQHIVSSCVSNVVVFKMKRLDYKLFDEVLSQAEVSPRHRMHYDLRTSVEEQGWKDMSQRMLNVLMADTVVPIHRHKETNEVVIVMRGRGCEVLYDGQGNELERIEMSASSDCPGVVVPKGAWHTFFAHEDGTVIFEAKDRPYDPILTEEFLSL